MPTDTSSSSATAFNVALLPAELNAQMRGRLGGSAVQGDVVWRKDRQRLLIHTATLATRVLEGWLLVNLEVETDQTKRQSLQFVFHVGKTDAGDGTAAACTINAATPAAALLVGSWGRDLQRVLWDAVLDGIEVCVAQVAQQSQGKPVTLGGFWADAAAVQVNLVAGTF